MKKLAVTAAIFAATLLPQVDASAQSQWDLNEDQKKEVQEILKDAKGAESPIVITLEQALMIALSENVSVKVADMEIQRTEYAKKGSYAALFPQIDATGAYQRTIKKQVMYMDFDMSSLMGGAAAGGAAGGATDGTGTEGGDVTGGTSTESTQSSSNGGGIEMGRWNTWSAGVSAAMPLVNLQLWKGLKISGMDVELAVEKARSSRLDMVSQVKNAYFSVLLAKEAFDVYKQVYENAFQNCEIIKQKVDAKKASEVEYLRAKTTLKNAIPNVYNAESSVILALWQLKAILGVDLDMNLDVKGGLDNFTSQMNYDSVPKTGDISLDMNTTMKQLQLQTMMLAETIKLQKYANIPSLAVAFSFTLNAMTNDFNFQEYRWTPYSYVGLSLNIPIFSGGKRYQQIRQAKNQYAQVQCQVQNTERQLMIAISQQINTMQTNMRSYEAATEAMTTAQKAYDIMQKSLEVGRSTLIEVNDAQLALTQAQLASYQAVYNFLLAKTQLEQIIGQDFTNK